MRFQLKTSWIGSTMPNTKQKYLKKVKFSRYRPGVAQRVGRATALLFHDRGTRRGWVVSSTPQPHFTPEKDPVPVIQEAGWAPGAVWTGGKMFVKWSSIQVEVSVLTGPQQSLDILLSCCGVYSVTFITVALKWYSQFNTRSDVSSKGLWFGICQCWHTV